MLRAARPPSTRRSALAIVPFLAACSTQPAGRAPVAHPDVPPAVDLGDPDVSDAPEDVAPPTGPREVVRFDPGQTQYPTGIAVRSGKAYVALNALGLVMEVTRNGRFSLYVDLRLPSGTPRAALTGVAFDSVGRLLVGVSAPGAPSRGGIWRAPAGGGTAEPFIRNDRFATPGGVAVDGEGGVWSTDTSSGVVWRFTPDGLTGTMWSSDPLLMGGAPACGPVPAYRTGVNGLVVDLPGRALWATNSDRARVVRVAIQPDGSAGEATVVSPDRCAQLRGVSGLARAPDGSFVLTAPLVDVVARLSPTGVLTAVDAPAGLFHTPVDVAIDVNGDVWVANSGGVAAVTPGGDSMPGVVLLPVK